MKRIPALLTSTLLCLVFSAAGARAAEKRLALPDVPPPQAQDSVPMGDSRSFPEMKLDIPIAPGPFEPTWASIEKNYPGEPAWLREAKFGIWVHFGPQSAGESGDWYARKLYVPGTAPTKIISRNTAIRPSPATRKSCAIGIPPSLIPPRSRRFIRMPARAS